MKRNGNLWSILILLLICCSCEQGERVIQRPAFTLRTSNSLEIDKVVLNDTATIFYIDAFYRPNYWIRIDSGTYLKAGEQKIPVVGSNDIKLHDYHWMPETGKSSFQLIFPPLSRSIREVDFIESDCEECFKIYGIQLKPGAEAPDVTAPVPGSLKEVQALAKSELPKFDLKVGKTGVNVHLLGYRKELGNATVSLYLNDFMMGEQRELAAQVDDKGECRFEFDQYGTLNGFVDVLDAGGSILLAPGEEIDLYIDLVTMNQRQSPYLQETVEGKPSIYSTGKYAAINTLKSVYGYRYYFQTHAMDFFKAVHGLNADQYVDFVMQQYRLLADSIRRDTINPSVINELNSIENRAGAMEAICSYPGLLETAAHIVENIPWDQKADIKISEFTPKHYQVLKELDLNHPEMLYSQTFSFGYPSIYMIPDWKETLGVEQGILPDLQKIEGIAGDIMDMKPLSPQHEAKLKSMDNAFYQEAFQTMTEELQKQQLANKAKGGYRICEVPEVSNDKLFDAIIADYKGKVVFVDFWATWCGPCRAAIKDLEPAKSAELKNENIVFVYLTGSSSPLGTWQNMIPDIKGNHYRLSKDQWDTVCDKFGIRGIPSYVLVDKSGKYSLREDLREHNMLKAVLLEEAEK